MNKANIITIICLILIFCFIGILLLFIAKEDKTNEVTEFDTIQKLDDNSLFFTVSFNINKICEYVSSNQNQALYSIMDEQYLVSNNILLNNIIDKFSEKYKNTSFTATQIYVISKGKDYMFFVKGNLKTEIMDEPANIKGEDYFLFNYDIENSIFSIEPIVKSDYLKLIDSKKFEFKNLIENEYNKIDYVNITDENLAFIYFNDFISLLFTDGTSAYNKISDVTKQNYFNTYDEFNKYFENNLEKFQTLKFTKYSVKNGIIHYADNYNNKYSFIIKNIMDYEVIFIKEEDVSE